MDIYSKRIYFLEASYNDINYIVQLENDRHNRCYINLWLPRQHEEAMGNDDIKHFIIMDRLINQKIGIIILRGFSSKDDSIELLRIVIDFKGNGFGEEALRLVQDWVFNTVKANRLWLDVNTENTKALKLYQKVNFTLEGTLRECIKTDQGYQSLHVMSLLKDEYLRVHSSSQSEI
ncbi:GNAT family N-acetyltransferase [Amphibacillus sediminis]|uniref:GNAT family N-acetyltransferase n=1 Tax=Amphibacillus sediminis TaxID=360185 RepID=UPI00082AF0DC|nr:GNAT family protein [Amphibacillus sediminis]